LDGREVTHFVFLLSLWFSGLDFPPSHFAELRNRPPDRHGGADGSRRRDLDLGIVHAFAFPVGGPHQDGSRVLATA
jgi:hypothetical protein